MTDHQCRFDWPQQRHPHVTHAASGPDNRVVAGPPHARVQACHGPTGMRGCGCPTGVGDQHHGGTRARIASTQSRVVWASEGGEALVERHVGSLSAGR